MRPESVNAIDALLDTVRSIKKELETIKTSTDLAQINMLEERIRHECQVIEAAPGYMGQDIHRQIMNRRLEIRSLNRQEAMTKAKEVLDGSGDSGASGNPGDGDRADEPQRIELSGDKQASKPAKQSRRKK